MAKADVFLQRALKLLSDVTQSPGNLETRRAHLIKAFSSPLTVRLVQALLLLTQFLQGTQRSMQTYNFQGLTVRLAFQLGLHCISNGSKDTVVEREIKSRCWAMTFILDR